MTDGSLPGPSVVGDEVPLFHSSSESDREADPVQPKRRKEGRIWLFEKRISNIKSAEELIKNEKLWSFHKCHCTEEGVKRYYRCNKVKSRSVQCSAALYLLLDASSDDIMLFRTQKGHDHENLEFQSKCGMSNETKKEIDKLFELRLKPKSIMSNLSKIEGLTLPSMRQLNNYLTILRKKKYGSAVISLGELESWLIANSEIPSDDHQVFVAAHEVSKDDSNPSFRFLLSTKYLIGLSRQCNIIHADATYKLIWQGFPVLIVGTTDRDKHFHSFGLAVTTTEQTTDFVFLFQTLKNTVFSLYSYDLTCKVLVCDAAKSIQNAFVQVFGQDAIIRMCWSHAKKKIQVRVEQSVQKKSQKDILKDIDSLQCASTKEVFDRACEMFLDKWKDEKKFVSYFKDEWLIQNRCWYLGAAPGTNNALESFNRIIKDKGILPERHPLARFLIIASDMVKAWSNEYTTNSERGFSHQPTISLKIWTKAYQWAKLSKRVSLKHTNEMKRCYRIPGGDAMECETFEHLWESFDDYKKQHFSEWEVQLPQDEADWLNGTCNCPDYLKNYVCKHLVGLAIRLKFVEAPTEARNVPIGEKRKRGRPAKAKKALLMQ